MKRVNDHIRDHLLAGVMPEAKLAPSLVELRKTEWNRQFERLQRNRLIMGALRYGRIASDNHPPGKTRADYLREKVDVYQKTGNLEALVDAANLAMLEFTHSKHPKRHWHAEDRA